MTYVIPHYDICDTTLWRMW